LAHLLERFPNRLGQTQSCRGLNRRNQFVRHFDSDFTRLSHTSLIPVFRPVFKLVTLLVLTHGVRPASKRPEIAMRQPVRKKSAAMAPPMTRSGILDLVSATMTAAAITAIFPTASIWTSCHSALKFMDWLLRCPSMIAPTVR